MDYSRQIRQARSLVLDVAAGQDSYENLQDNERVLLGEVRERLEALEKLLLR